MIKVGLTGGIGSGKTYVSKFLKKLGYFVFYSDDEAKRIMQEEPDVIKKITQLFGEKAYAKDTLNRTFLAQQIFKNEDLKEQLNAIVHPAVRKAFDKWALDLENNKDYTANIVFNEAAILFETGSYKSFDYTILVTAPKDIRIQRVMDRDKVAKEAVLQRIENQWEDDQKAKLASFIIINDGKEDVSEQLAVILEKIKKQ